ncbi:MAG: hydroxymethylglutaryl-CoA lyase [Desulfovermiculus sp.]
MNDGKQIALVEVGPRDGLQSEDTPVATQSKVDFIACLIQAGMRRIQVASFVHPRRVPQMADAEQLLAALPCLPDVEYSALVLNRTGLNRALGTSVQCIEISISASTTHSQKNTGMSRHKALAEAQDMIKMANDQGFAVRASVQCAFGCVYEGEIHREVVGNLAEELVQAGAKSLALADTTGMGHPEAIRRGVELIRTRIPQIQLALHLHDTLGLGLVNVFAALQSGVRCFDVSCGGLGGCPFVPGAAGNIATEDTAFVLDKLGYTTGVDWSQAARCTLKMEEFLGRRLPAKLRPECMPEGLRKWCLDSRRSV